MSKWYIMPVCICKYVKLGVVQWVLRRGCTDAEWWGDSGRWPTCWSQHHRLQHGPEERRWRSWPTGTFQHCTLSSACFTFLAQCCMHLPSVLWCCWLHGRKGIQPVENWVVGCWCGYLSGARCRHDPADATASLPLTVSCFSKIQIGFTFLVPAHLGCPGQRAVKHVCLYICCMHLLDVAYCSRMLHIAWSYVGHCTLDWTTILKPQSRLDIESCGPREPCIRWGSRLVPPGKYDWTILYLWQSIVSWLSEWC